MRETTRNRGSGVYWADRNHAREFNDEVLGLNEREEVEVGENDEVVDLRLDLEPNPFLLADDDRDERVASKVSELQGRFEQEIQELDEAEIAADNDLKNRFLDRMLPGHARSRAENYAEARDARMYELGMSLSELDYHELGGAQLSNDESLVREEVQETRKKGLDLEF